MIRFKLLGGLGVGGNACSVLCDTFPAPNPNLLDHNFQSRFINLGRDYFFPHIKVSERAFNPFHYSIVVKAKAENQLNLLGAGVAPCSKHQNKILHYGHVTGTSCNRRCIHFLLKEGNRVTIEMMVVKGVGIEL